MKHAKNAFLPKCGKLFLTGAAMMCCLAAQGATYHWTFEGEGNWGDATKWHKWSETGSTGELPGVEDDVIIDSVNGTINVDTEYEVQSLTTGYGTAAVGRICTLKGNGKLTIVPKASATSSPTTFQINRYYTLVMDGPDIYCKKPTAANLNSVQYCEGGTLIIKRGTYTPGYHYLKTGPGRLVVDGGTATSYDAETGQYSATRLFHMQNGWNGDPEPVCFIDLKSGLLETRCLFKVGTFTMTGGTWDRSRVLQGTTFPDMLATNTLSINICGGEKVAMHFYDDRINGDVRFWKVDELVENTSSVGSWWPISEEGNYSFGSISAPKSTLTITNDNVVLSGNSLSVRSLEIANVHNMTLNVPNMTVNGTDASLYFFGAYLDRESTLRVYSHGKMHFESTAPCKVWTMYGTYNSDIYWRFHEGLDVSTTAADGTSAVNYTIYNPFFDAGATADFSGVGDVMLYWNNYIGAGRNVTSFFSNQISRISSKGGGTLELANWSWNARDYPFQTERFVLGPGTKLKTPAATYSHLDANEVELDPTSELVFSTPDKDNSNFPPAPLTTGPRHVNDFQTPETRPTVTLSASDAAEEWNFKWINGQPVVWRKNVSERGACNLSREKLSKWRGTVDGVWTNSANWLIDTGKVQADDPLEQAMVFDGGYTNTRITVDSTVKAFQICVFEKTAPVAFVGNGAIKLGSTSRTDETVGVSDAKAAIGSKSDHPVVFDVPVSLSETITSDRYLTVTHNGRGYVAFMKALDAGTVFTMKGDVRIGGTATAQNIIFNGQTSAFPAKRTRLSIIPGGSFTLTGQDWLQYADNVEIHVYSNATFTVMNPSNVNCCWGVNVARRPSWVKEFGKFDCRAPLGGTGKVSFKGKGEVRLADTGSRATADYPVELEDVTFAIDSFTAGHPIVLKGSPTWAAKTDWTYSLDSVSLPAGETLTVDTGDLDTGVGHSVAINSALSADKLVKKGAGTLALGSGANALGKVAVEEGTLSIAASQSFDSLTVASGAGLHIAANATVALSGSIDLTDVTLASGAGKNWATVLTVPEGSAITGVPADDAHPFMMRVVESGTGLALQMRRRHGATISFR